MSDPIKPRCPQCGQSKYLKPKLRYKGVIVLYECEICMETIPAAQVLR